MVKGRYSQGKPPTPSLRLGLGGGTKFLPLVVFLLFTFQFSVLISYKIALGLCPKSQNCSPEADGQKRKAALSPLSNGH